MSTTPEILQYIDDLLGGGSPLVDKPEHKVVLDAIANSFLNKTTDANLLGLYQHDPLRSYLKDQGVFKDGELWKANQNITPEAWNIAKWDQITGTTSVSDYNISDWEPDFPGGSGNGYSQGQQAVRDERIWSSDSDSNTQDPLVSGWTELSASAGAYGVDWLVGLYKQFDTVTNPTDRKLYYLDVPTPSGGYTSSDLDAEIIAGDWLAVPANGIISGAVNNTIRFNSSGLQEESSILQNDGTDITITGITKATKGVEVASATETQALKDVDGDALISFYSNGTIEVSTDNGAFNYGYMSLSPTDAIFGIGDGLSTHTCMYLTPLDYFLQVNDVETLIVAPYDYLTEDIDTGNTIISARYSQSNGDIYNNSVIAAGTGQIITEDNALFTQRLIVDEHAKSLNDPTLDLDWGVFSYATKGFVEAQIGANDTLAEILSNGNVSGANDVYIDEFQKLSTPSVEFRSSEDSSIITDADSNIRFLVDPIFDDLYITNDIGGFGDAAYIYMFDIETWVGYKEGVGYSSLWDETSYILYSEDSGQDIIASTRSAYTTANNDAENTAISARDGNLNGHLYLNSVIAAGTSQTITEDNTLFTQRAIIDEHLKFLNDPSLDLAYGLKSTITEEILDKRLGLGVNVEYIATAADLPAAVGGVITLESKTYVITNGVDLSGDRIVCPTDNCAIKGLANNLCTLKSTGLTVSPLITANRTLILENITIEAETAFAFDGTGGSNVLFFADNLNLLNCDSIGTFEVFEDFVVNRIAFINSGGITFDGAINTIEFDNCLFNNKAGATAITVPATANISTRLRVSSSLFSVLATSTGLNVSASATIGTQSYILHLVDFSGAGTYITGLSSSDNESYFVDSIGIDNSSEIGGYYMNDNATATTIATVDTPVKAAGTTTALGVNQKFTHASNKLTYDGALQRTFKISATTSVTSGNSNQIKVYIAKNGTVLNESVGKGTTGGAGRAENIVSQTAVSLSSTDYIEIFVENDTLNDITVTDLNVLID